MNKKFYTKTVLLGVLILVMLLACMNVSAKQKKIKLVYWTYVEEYTKTLDYYRVQLKEFQKKYPHVDIEFLMIPYEGSDAKLLTAFTGRKNAPDMFVGKVPYFAGGLGVAEPVPADLAKHYDNVIVDKIKEFVKHDGKFYGYPLESDLGMMLFYNTDMFKEAGLDPNKPPRTLDELVDYAKKLTKYDKDGNITRQGFAIRFTGNPTGIADKWLPFLHACGGRLYSPDGKKASGYINSPESIEALQFYVDLVYKYKVSSLTLGKPDDTFPKGQAAMFTRESWQVGWLKENAPDISFATSPLVSGRATPGISLLFTQAIMVYKYGPNKDMCWEWLRFITTKEHDMHIAKLEGYLPVHSENFKDDYVAKRVDYNEINNIMESPASPYYGHPKITEISYIVGEAIVEALTKQKTPKEALDFAARQMDRLMAEL